MKIKVKMRSSGGGNNKWIRERGERERKKGKNRAKRNWRRTGTERRGKRTHKKGCAIKKEEEEERGGIKRVLKVRGTRGMANIGEA